MSNTARLAGAVALALALGLAPGAAAESFTFSGDRLVVANLIGEVTIEGGGSSFEVEVTRGGSAGDEIDIVQSDGRSAELLLKFPKASSYIYPRLGSRSSSTISMGNNNSGDWLSQMINGLTGRDRIKVRGSGSGTEVWADVKITVPSGATLEVRQGVGKGFARNVDGDVELYVKSGSIEASGTSGRFVADTGSGHVEIEDARGELIVDTGSGHVTAERIDVDDLSIDTGSGHVEVDDVRARSVLIDTGSGHVTAERVSTDSAEIDTGSGGVELELERMGNGRFVIDTGSGGVRLRLPADASAEIEADTGSGGIDLDLTGTMTMRSKSRDNVRFTLGGGAAEISIDTGSGGIRISQ